MRRREFLLTAAAPLISSAAVAKSELSVEGYIFMQYAQLLKKPLAEVISEVLPMARSAGFNNMELNTAFFEASMRDRTLALIKPQGLRMPSVYVGGSMHEKDAADQTIARALQIGRLCAPFGCTGIVNNPDPKPKDQPKTDAELAVEEDCYSWAGRCSLHVQSLARGEPSRLVELPKKGGPGLRNGYIVGNPLGQKNAYPKSNKHSDRNALNCQPLYA